MGLREGRRRALLGLDDMDALAVEGVKGVIFCHFWENEAMRAVVEGVEIVIPCHFWAKEAMRAVVGGVEIIIFCF